MSHNYIVSAQKPTAVMAAACGNFTSPTDLNLIIAKTNRLELLVVSPTGLKPLQECPVNGRITHVQFFRPTGSNKDLLFMLTQKYHAAIIEYIPGEGGGLGTLETRSFGNVADRVGRPAEMGTNVDIDVEHQLIGMRLYDGSFKLIHYQKDCRELKATNLRFTDMSIPRIQFLQGCKKPTVVYLYQENTGEHLKTQEINMVEKEFTAGPWKQENVEAESGIIISLPGPTGGVVVVGQESVSYHKGEGNYVAVAPPLMSSSAIVCYAPVDANGTRYLLGDLSGRLFMLILDIQQENQDSTPTVKDLRVELLGETTIPECMVYLDNGVVYIGSRLGDSQLIRLSEDPISPEDPNNFIEVLDTYTNLGPILDMAVVDLERQGQGQLVTCSGAFKEGSLRIIRNGIGINELASMDLPGIKGIWNVKLPSSQFDNLLVVSFVGESRTLFLDGEEVEEKDIDGFDPDNQTIWSGNILDDNQFCQITGQSIRLINKDGLKCEWTLPGKKRINLASANSSTGQVVLAAGKCLHYLKINGSEIREESQKELEFEIACVDISPINGDKNRNSELCAVGLWTQIAVRLFSLPDFSQLVSEELGGEIIARSILMCNLDNQLYLLIGLGDGTLFYYQMNNSTGALMDKKKVTLGTQPMQLKPFQSRGSINVFACSDRPTVIYSSNQKLVFSNVNLKLVGHLCPLNAVGYADSLAMADDQSLMIGRVDEIQKLHIRTVPIGESVRRIAHQEETQTFGVLSHRYENRNAEGELIQRQSASLLAPNTSNSASSGRSNSIRPEDGEESEVHSLLILDQNTFEVVHAHSLGPNEHACSIISAHLGEDSTAYFVVGTALVFPDESDSKLGRLLVFQYAGDGKLQLVHEKELKGSPFSLALINSGNKLVAAINSSVRIFEWTPEKELRLETSYFNFITALYLKTKGDFVVAGDMMRSICVLAYKQLEMSMDEIGRDMDSNWMTAVEIVDDDTYLGAENSYNLFTLQKDSSATNDEDRMRLQAMGLFHLGQMVNVFRKGSLVMEHPTGESSVPIAQTPILYGTVEGGIGLICQTSEDYFNFLSELEGRMRKSLKSTGSIDHEAWRAFEAERRHEPANGFIDGDLVEEFLDLPRSTQCEMTSGLELPPDEPNGMSSEATADDIVKLVEELSRIH